MQQEVGHLADDEDVVEPGGEHVARPVLDVADVEGAGVLLPGGGGGAEVNHRAGREGKEGRCRSESRFEMCSDRPQKPPQFGHLGPVTTVIRILHFTLLQLCRGKSRRWEGSRPENKAY